MIFRTFLAIVISLAFSGPVSQPRAEEPILHVSLIALLANPERFDGKLIQTIGVLQLGFEENGLFLSKEHLKNRVTIKAIWVTPSEEMHQQQETLNGAYVSIAGRFNAGFRGHMGLYSGALDEVMWAMRQPGT